MAIRFSTERHRVDTYCVDTSALLANLCTSRADHARLLYVETRCLTCENFSMTSQRPVAVEHGRRRTTDGDGPILGPQPAESKNFGV